MTTPLLSAEDATFRVAGRALVANASLAAAAGELVVIVGPNGAGKTTLMKLLTGELRPHAGRAMLDGEDVYAMAPWALAAQRAVMAQATRLSFPFAAAEIVRLGVDGLGRGLTPARRRAIVADALAAADVSALAGRLYQTLSGGEQQRVHFARALAQLQAGRTLGRPQALFLDEPVASLDLRHQLALMDAARDQAANGVCVVAILHDLNLAATFADRIVVMSRARIAADGRPADVLSRALIADVFGVDLPLSAAPARALPFILPQHHQAGATAV